MPNDDVIPCPHCKGTGEIRQSVAPQERTVAEVLAARKRAVEGGCCDRFADYHTCDCLEMARQYERSKIPSVCNLCDGKGHYNGCRCVCMPNMSCPTCKGEGWYMAWEGKASKRVACDCNSKGG